MIHRIFVHVGIHFTATAVPGKLSHSEVTGAGLLDPSSFEYSPAVLIDYNVQTLAHLHVHDNLQTGVLILHNDVYANATVRTTGCELYSGLAVQRTSTDIQRARTDIQ